MCVYEQPWWYITASHLVYRRTVSQHTHTLARMCVCVRVSATRPRNTKKSQSLSLFLSLGKRLNISQHPVGSGGGHPRSHTRSNIITYGIIIIIIIYPSAVSVCVCRGDGGTLCVCETNTTRVCVYTCYPPTIRFDAFGRVR